ncbi:MAG TPA: hypothetical protein ENJ21_06690 [Chromatiaceae bacterium]|nr:hypothetical protein [Chromatiaceae bacterium]
MKQYPVSSVAILAICVATLTACVTREESMVKQGYPRGYVEGFSDGCHSGKKAGGSMFDQFKKDVRRFDRDARYAQGWSDGFRQCETEEEAAERQSRMAIERQRMLDERKRYEDDEQRRMERDVLRGIDTRGLENLGK